MFSHSQVLSMIDSVNGGTATLAVVVKLIEKTSVSSTSSSLLAVTVIVNDVIFGVKVRLEVDTLKSSAEIMK